MENSAVRCLSTSGRPGIRSSRSHTRDCAGADAIAKHLRTVLLLAVTILSIARVVDGQGITPLTNNHPIVINHLIGLYTGLASQIAANNATDPANALSRQMGAQGIFGVSAAGYQSLGAVLSAAKAQLDTVQSAAAQYALQPASRQSCRLCQPL
jgi:hypothetical protein